MASPNDTTDPNGKLHQIASAPIRSPSTQANGNRITHIDKNKITNGAITAPVARTVPKITIVKPNKINDQSTTTLICCAMPIATLSPPRKMPSECRLNR
ncbi:hypothetical protein D3C72_1876780 [compost metagenome]